MAAKEDNMLIQTFFKIVSLQVVLWIALIVLIMSSVTYAQDQPISKQISQLLESLQPVAQKDLGQGKKPQEPPRLFTGPDGYLRSLGAPPSFCFPVATATPGKPEETAYSFLKENANLFGLTGKAVDLKTLKINHRNNRNYIRFEQTYKGLPVFGAQIIVQVNEFDCVEYVLSDIALNTQMLDDGFLSINPTISSMEAIKKARDLFLQKAQGFRILTTTPELKIFDPSVVGAAGTIRLVWDLKVQSEDSPHINEHILLDAHTGEIVRHYPLNIPALDREIYDSNNTTADPGTLERDEGDSASGIGDVDDAYDYFEDAYDFYNTHHGRDSINDGGMTISVTVRYCNPGKSCPYGNAFWSPGKNRLYFGDPLMADDIVGHEYTHGVTQYESGLIYENHSGAINESFSDVWGEFIDLGNSAGTDTTAVRWQIGEDTGSGASRDMSDPPNFGDPDRLGHPNFVSPVYNPTDSNDYGGVHTNSGVNNKLCYLLTDGDTFNGKTITGVGINTVANLYYEVQTNLLTAGSDYSDLYNAMTQAAINLSWTSGMRNNLKNACIAVEIAYTEIIYVDGAYTGTENGSAKQPFNTIAEGVSAVSSGGLLCIKSGSYNEIITFDKKMDVWPTDGTVTVGN